MYQETKHILTKTFEQECSIRVYIYLLAWLLLFSDRWTRPSRQSNITFLSFSLDNIPPFLENDHVYLAVMLIYRRITWLIWIIVQFFLKNILEYLLDKRVRLMTLWKNHDIMKREKSLSTIFISFLRKRLKDELSLRCLLWISLC